MSGDVQPRKRKDKKKKKDDLGVEEPRGTAAALGEGDVFMHSYSDHGTGGHWCAKVIFFSLLAVLITLIGLIILENRGLTELEANSVESRYSGVLEGWIEDAPDDDHHDEHTLELNHHDEDDEEHGSQLEHDEDDNHDDENEEHEDVDDEEHEHDDSGEDLENDEADDTENDEGDDSENDEETDQDADNSEEADADYTVDENDDDANEDSEEQNVNTAEEDEKENDVDDSVENQQYDDEENDDDLKKNDGVEKENEEDNSLENDDDDIEENDDDDTDENDDFLQNDADQEVHKKDEEEHEEEEVTNNIEIETIEKEVSDDDVASTEEPAQEDDDDIHDNQEDVSEESPPEEDASDEDDDVEFLEPDELDELPIVEPITAPKGKPLPEVGDSPSTEKPQDTLADEEEYERQQDELRREREQASQGMWLKLTVGGALLVATHAVLRRATASRETETEEEPDSREETPLSDRRMTLISEPVSPPTVTPKAPEVRTKEVEVEKEAFVKSSLVKDESEEEEEDIFVSKPMQSIQTAPATKDTIDKELYSDEEIEEELEDEEEEQIIPIMPTKSEPQQAVPQAPIPDVTKEVTPEPEDDDDVEIIDEEQLEEEMEEEEISDVDDAELLTRLEEKYGRLPDPEPARPPRHKDGGNSIEDEWPGEPADAFWSQRLDQAQRDMREGEWAAALETASSPALANSGRARYIVARALDAAAEAKKDNQVLSKAIAAYLEVLKMNERLSDAKLLEVASRALDRIKFRGTYLRAEPVYKLLIRRFPNDPAYRNNLTISLLMANRVDLAENVLKETLQLWPNDRVALAHYGFILKTVHNRLEDAVEAFSKALEGDAGAANEPRFYYHLGDALLLMGRFDDAHKVHKRGAELGHFLSPAQRSLYNVNRLKSKPWWNVHQTPYSRLARALEKSWKEILKEGEAARALYEKEKEGLRERGEWSQLDLFVRGREVPDRCSRATVTCGIIKSEIGASGCRRGQIKFSMMEAGTHVRPHVGPTNCRLRMHLGLSNTKDTFLRVDQETRQWQTGKVLMFDDSFEHEVWHNGTGTRLVLIVDVWHPDLTPNERRQLPAI